MRVKRRAAVTSSHKIGEHPTMTVAEALGAHASAQIAAAREADKQRRVAVETEPELVPEESRSFIETWAIQATVIGLRPQ
jgi:hypothetical protein